MRLLVIVLLGAALRFYELGARSWWFDEAVTVDLLRQDFWSMLADVPASEGAPPLYYALAWLWTQVLGTGEAGLRSFGALVGVLTIPVVYACGRRIASERAGLIAALLVAVSPQLVWHAQDARAYSLWVLACALTILATLRAIEDPSRGRLAAWAAAAALAAATHYFAAFLIAGEAVWLLAVTAPDARRRLWGALAAVGVAGLALAPIAVAQSGHAAQFLAHVPLLNRLTWAPVEAVVGYQPPWAVVLTAAGALCGAATLWALWRARSALRAQPAVLWLAGIGLASLAAPVLLLPVSDWITTRNLLASWVPLALVVAVALARVPLVAGAYAAVAVVIVVGSATAPKWEHDDWRTAFDALGPAPAAGRVVVLNPGSGERPFRVYRGGAEIKDGPIEAGEVAVVILANERRFGHAPRPPRYRVPAPPGFREVARRDEPTFRTVRFAPERGASAPASVASLEALAASPSPRPSLVAEGARPRPPARAARP